MDSIHVKIQEPLGLYGPLCVDKCKCRPLSFFAQKRCNKLDHIFKIFRLFWIAPEIKLQVCLLMKANVLFFLLMLLIFLWSFCTFLFVCLLKKQIHIIWWVLSAAKATKKEKTFCFQDSSMLLFKMPRILFSSTIYVLSERDTHKSQVTVIKLFSNQLDLQFCPSAKLGKVAWKKK